MKFKKSKAKSKKTKGKAKNFVKEHTGQLVRFKSIEHQVVPTAYETALSCAIAGSWSAGTTPNNFVFEAAAGSLITPFFSITGVVGTTFSTGSANSVVVNTGMGKSSATTSYVGQSQFASMYAKAIPLKTKVTVKWLVQNIQDVLACMIIPIQDYDGASPAYNQLQVATEPFGMKPHIVNAYSSNKEATVTRTINWVKMSGLNKSEYIAKCLAFTAANLTTAQFGTNISIGAAWTANGNNRILVYYSSVDGATNGSVIACILELETLFHFCEPSATLSN